MIGKIYKLYSNNSNMVYIGSTINKLNIRLNNHKHTKNRCVSSQIIKSGDYHIELIKEINYNNIKTLKKYEGYYQSITPFCINKNIAGKIKTDKYICECGTTIHRRDNIKRHQRTIKHKNLLKRIF